MASLTSYIYDATVVSIHDADSVTVRIRLATLNPVLPDCDFGFHIYLVGGILYLQVPVRLLGLNTAELRTPAGKAARDYLCSLLAPGDLVQLASSKTTKPVAPDKYGDRWDGVLTKAGVNINQQLIATGWAAAWNGKGKKPVPAWPRVAT